MKFALQKDSPVRQVPFRSLSEYDDVLITGRRLPHWTQHGTTYFITFRLGDAIPASIQEQWRIERQSWLHAHPAPWTATVAREYKLTFSVREEKWLDKGAGKCHLRDPRLRTAVVRHLCHFDGERYDLDAWVIMPNHVHCLLTPRNGHDLFDLLKGIKGCSARSCNRLLGRSGDSFWMDDSYNRIVRNATQLEAYRNYIERNPESAKLREGEYSLQMNSILYVEQ